MQKVIIMGAGGRDFHDFNLVFREDQESAGGRVHRGADPRYRRPRVPGLARRAPVPGGDPDRAGGAAGGADRLRGRGRGRPRVLRPRARGRDAQGVGRSRRRRRLPAPRPPLDDAAGHEAGRRRDRGPHRLRQEPDEPPDRRAAARRRVARRARPSPDAVRRPGGDARAAVRDARRHRRVASDHRGTRGVRASRRDGDDRLRGRGLRRDPRARRRRVGRDHLGRRQQRLSVLLARPLHRRRRPAARRPRAGVPPRRGEPPHGRRRRHEQDRQRRARVARGGAEGHPARQLGRRTSCSRGRPSSSRTDRRSKGSGCWSSRTARP